MSKEQTSDLFQKAKDQVAKKYGHDSWDSLLELSPSWEYDEVAKLYASLQNAELIKEVMDKIWDAAESYSALNENSFAGGLRYANRIIELHFEKYTDKK